MQNGRHLVDKGARSARTAAVHAHIGNFQLSGCLIDAEEDDFCVLSSQFNGGAHAVILAAQRNGVGNHLLNIGEAQGVRQTLGSGSGQRQMDLGLRLARTERPQRVGYTLDLVGMVPLVIRVYNPAGLFVQGDDFGGGRTHINSNLQDIIFSVHACLCFADGSEKQIADK